MIRTNIRIYLYKKKQYKGISEYIRIKKWYEQISEFIHIKKNNTNEYLNIFASKKWYEYDTNEYSYWKIFEYIRISEYSPHPDSNLFLILAFPCRKIVFQSIWICTAGKLVRWAPYFLFLDAQSHERDGCHSQRNQSFLKVKFNLNTTTPEFFLSSFVYFGNRWHQPLIFQIF